MDAFMLSPKNTCGENMKGHARLFSMIHNTKILEITPKFLNKGMLELNYSTTVERQRYNELV